MRNLNEVKALLAVESRMKGGQAVRITRGPLAGLEGSINQRVNSTRLLVATNCRAILIEIDDSLVELI